MPCRRWPDVWASRALVVTDARLAGEAVFQDMIAALRDAGLQVRVDASTLPDVPVDLGHRRRRGAARPLRLIWSLASVAAHASTWRNAWPCC